MSISTDATGKKRIDTAELARVYGELDYLEGSENGTDGNSHRENMEQHGTDENSSLVTKMLRLLPSLRSRSLFSKNNWNLLPSARVNSWRCYPLNRIRRASLYYLLLKRRLGFKIF